MDPFLFGEAKILGTASPQVFARSSSTCIGAVSYTHLTLPTKA